MVDGLVSISLTDFQLRLLPIGLTGSQKEPLL
uniref:Uncharacterized protein n=1 Tax=Tetranychus urticae TaxID=32264 RepID=T1KHA6_TETUR